MAVTYAEVAAQASELSASERWLLATELLLADDRPRLPASAYFGVNGVVAEDVDARIRRDRDE